MEGSVRSPAQRSSLGICGAGSIGRKPAEPSKIRKEGERRGDVCMPGAPVSGLDGFFVQG